MIPKEAPQRLLLSSRGSMVLEDPSAPGEVDHGVAQQSPREKQAIHNRRELSPKTHPDSMQTTAG